ncbi:protein LURP-one-related 12-like [Iris pallida]|uniref:Protein LURP-one-related 12-like n=1 Tax=Iris pallida TaxID=29817 RepID=A0AAX6ERQ9_IRIPA|nr:protein LURP-one-related 12-like [Iris pallida]
MGKIHPTVSNKSGGAGAVMSGDSALPSVWTVWKKSSMTFQGTDGFSVYDGEGRLAFRVDNYSRKHKELLLMDGAGRPLLALRPQVLSIHDQWNGFRSDDGLTKVSSKSQVFSMRRRRSFLLLGGGSASSNGLEIFTSGGCTTPDFRIEGSFGRRSCKILSRSGDVVAQISRKKAAAGKSVVLGDDVFSLAVRPGADCDMVMAFVVAMDRICPKRNAPVMCY